LLRDTAMPRRPSTKALLIDVGERLFGRYGFDGISLREIAMAAGQGNTRAVQYHFGDRSGLVAAILKDRYARVETRRAERIAALSNAELNDPRELLKVLWLPGMSIKGADGSHTYCHFLMQYMLRRDIAEHPVVRAHRRAQKPDGKTAGDPPSLMRGNQLLQGHYGHLSLTTIERRVRAQSVMFLSSVVEYDNVRLNNDGAPAEFDIEPILDMAIGALSAPGRDG